MLGQTAEGFDGDRRVGHPPGVRQDGDVVDVDVLGLDELHQALDAVGAAAAGIFEAAPRRLADAVRVKHLIDADGAGLDLPGHSFAFLNVARPDAGGKAEFGIVG